MIWLVITTWQLRTKKLPMNRLLSLKRCEFIGELQARRPQELLDWQHCASRHEPPNPASRPLIPQHQKLCLVSMLSTYNIVAATNVVV